MDVLQPDIAICGGLSGAARIVALAEIYDRPVVPHVWGSIINFSAAVHLTATLPAHRAGARVPFPWLEYDAGPNPLMDLVGRPKVNADGTVSVPDGPGLGIALSRAMLEPFVTAHREITR
jgi:D-galactarolactone cycloisomerase